MWLISRSRGADPSLPVYKRARESTLLSFSPYGLVGREQIWHSPFEIASGRFLYRFAPKDAFLMPYVMLPVDWWSLARETSMSGRPMVSRYQPAAG